MRTAYKKSLSRALVSAFVCLPLSLSAALAADDLHPTYQFDIPAQSLEDALQALALASQHKLFYDTIVVKGKSSPPVRGEFTTEEAVRRMLSGTDLTYEITEDGLVLIRRPGTPAAQDNKDRAIRLSQVDGSALGASPTEAGGGASQSSSANGDPTLTEIVVTAQKRLERLIDTPQSISVLSSDAIERMGAKSFLDFASSVPGLSFSTAGAGNTRVTMRGVTVGYDVGASTVGIYVDEVPYGASGAFGGNSLLGLDVGLFDIDRIEVLRGPQGTLYGSSTMGGLIKYVTKRPSSTEFEVETQAGVSTTRRGGTGYHGAGALNLPLASDTAALRLTGFYSHEGGYIDNLALGKKDVNQSDAYGGRADLLLTPTEPLSIRITAFAQNLSREGEATSEFNFDGSPLPELAGQPLNDKLGQYRPLAEPFDQHFRLISATATYDLGSSLEVTSVSSYQEAKSEFIQDSSIGYVPLLEFYNLFYGAVGTTNPISVDKFTQEVRLTRSRTGAFEWALGALYTDEDSQIDQDFVLLDRAGNPAPNILLVSSNPSSYEEHAGFGDLTWYLSDRLDVTGGIRYAHGRQENEKIQSGAFAQPNGSSKSTDSVFTYLANGRYHFTDRATGYVRFATGYRPGGPNFVAVNPNGGLSGINDRFESDSLKSYEAGFKAETSDRRFAVDLAAYSIDWSNIQMSIIRQGFSGLTNASGGADIRGAELALSARPTHAWNVTGTFAFVDASLSKDEPDLGGRKGERLPNSPKFTAAVDTDYAFSDTGYQPTIGATVRYVGNHNASFDGTAGFLQYEIPEYTTVDLRAGLTFGSVNARLYVRNLLDERGQLSALNTWQGIARPAIQQPRTFGANFYFQY
jgi:outer membrane receptor protein involved in Fe transport